MANELDEDMGRELEVFLENDAQLYKSMIVPGIRMLMKYKKKGTYRQDLAIKWVIGNVLPEVIKRYRKNVAKIPNVSAVTKYWVAKRWVEYFETEAKYGNYDGM